MSALRRTTIARFARCALLVGAAATALLPGGPASAAQEQKVGAFFIDYVPHAVSINQGDTLTFVNTDPFSGEGHSFTQGTYGGVAPRFDSGVVPLGQDREVAGVSSLPQGEYIIQCRVHPPMKGSLFVDPPARSPVDALNAFLNEIIQVITRH
jgi:plastocyanin